MANSEEGAFFEIGADSTTLVQQLDAAAEAVKEFQKSISATASVTTPVIKNVSELSSAIELLNTSVQQMVATIQTAATQFIAYTQQMTDQVGKLSAEFSSGGVAAGEALSDGILSKTKEITPQLTSQFGTGAVSAVTSQLRAVGADGGNALLTELTGALKEGRDDLNNAFTTVEPFDPVLAQAREFSTKLDSLLTVSSAVESGMGMREAAEKFELYINAMETEAISLSQSLKLSGQKAGTALVDGLAQKLKVVSSEINSSYGSVAQAAFIENLRSTGLKSGNVLVEAVVKTATGSDMTQVGYSVGSKLGKGVASGISSTSGEIKTSLSSLSDIGTGLRGVFDPLISALRTGILTIGTALGGIGAAAITAGAEFESAMTRVSAIAGASNEELEALKQKALDLGKTLPVSARDSADAMESLAQAGLDTKTVLESVTAVAQLATAQQMSMGSAADMVASTMVNFGLKATDASHITDVFTTAANKSLLTISKLSDGLRYAAQLAGTVGLSLEETVAAMEALSNAGLRGEQIGTGLRGVLSSLYNPSAAAQKVLDSLGVTVVDAGGKAKDFYTILKQLQEAGVTTTEIFKLFDNEAATAAITLIKTAGSLDSYASKLKESGSTATMVATTMETMTSQWTLFTNSLERTRISIFDQMKEGLLSVVSGFDSGITTIEAWLNKTNAAEMAMQSFLSGVLGGVVDLNSFESALNSIDLSAVQVKFTGLGTAVKGFSDAVITLGSAVPWEFLSTHLATIGKTLVVGWAAEKLVGIAEAVSALAKGFVALNAAISLKGITAFFIDSAGLTAVGSSVVWFGTLAVALALLVEVWSEVNDKAEEFEKQLVNIQKQGEKSEEIAKNFTAAINGNAEALGKLPAKYQDLVAVHQKEQAAIQATVDQRQRDVDAINYEKSALELLAYQRKQDIRLQEESQTEYATSVTKAVESIMAEYESVSAASQKAMSVLGLSATNAGKVIEADLKKKITDVVAEINKNSALGSTVSAAFIQQITAIANQIGGPLLNAVKSFGDQSASMSVQIISSARATILGLSSETTKSLNDLGTTLSDAMSTALLKYKDVDAATVAVYKQFAPKIKALSADGLSALQAMFSKSSSEMKTMLSNMTTMSKQAATSITATFSSELTKLTSASSAQTQAYASQIETTLRVHGANSAQAVATLIDQQAQYAISSDSTIVAAAAQRDAAIESAEAAFRAFLEKSSAEGLSITTSEISEQQKILDAAIATANAQFTQTQNTRITSVKTELTKIASDLQAAFVSSGQTVNSWGGVVSEQVFKIGTITTTVSGNMIRQFNSVTGEVTLLGKGTSEYGDALASLQGKTDIAGNALTTLGTVASDAGGNIKTGIVDGTTGGVDEATKQGLTGGQKIATAVGTGLQQTDLTTPFMVPFNNALNAGISAVTSMGTKMANIIIQAIEKADLPTVLTTKWKIPSSPIETHYSTLMKKLTSLASTNGAAAGRAYSSAYNAALSLNSGATTTTSDSSVITEVVNPNVSVSGASSVAKAAASAGLV